MRRTAFELDLRAAAPDHDSSSATKLPPSFPHIQMAFVKTKEIHSANVKRRKAELEEIASLEENKIQ